MSEHAERLAEVISSLERELLLIVTGAGVSAPSGIPTFRGSEPDAVWRASDVELATFEFFQRDPVSQWSWYLKRFEKVETARPNPAHAALADLERWQTDRGGRFQIVTQNIDTLHEVAGSNRLIKIHGTSARFRCSRPGCRYGAPTGSVSRDNADVESFRANPCRATLPRCPDCGAVLRAHVLFFDEYYQDHEDYRFDEALELAGQAAVFLFVGTSFSVGITEILSRVATEAGAPIFSIDPAGAPPSYFPIAHLPVGAESVLPRLAELLRGRAA